MALAVESHGEQFAASLQGAAQHIAGHGQLVLGQDHTGRVASDAHR